MTSSKFKNLIFISLAVACGFISGISLLIKPTAVLYAEQTTGMPNYFSAQIGEDDISTDMSENTFFLDDGKDLTLKLSKDYSNGTGQVVYNNYNGTALGTENTDYVKVSTVEFTPDKVTPIDISTSAISLTINGKPSNITPEIKSYTYIYNSTNDGANERHYSYEFDYATLKIDNNSSFVEGKYELSLTNVVEFSGTDFSSSKTASYTLTFYVFKTTSYFNSVDTESPNIVFTNAEKAVTASTSKYESNYYFHYENISSETSTLNLPTLTFAKNKFKINIDFKNYQGNISSTQIYYDGTSLISPDNFVLARENNENIIITFNELGEYEISYEFIYVLDNEIISLQGEKITEQKPTRIDIFGYQMFYTDINISPEEDNLVEFKSFKADNTLDEQTDITYKKLENFISINPADLSPASTNQAPVSFRYNAKNNGTELYKWNEADNQFEEDTAYTKISSITEKGIYLLKVTYTYDYYIENNVYKPNKEFTQWFYFEITTSNQDSEILDETGEPVQSSTYTKDSVTVKLSENNYSVFNSPVRLVVESKNGNNWEKIFSTTSLEDKSNWEYVCEKVENSYKNYRVKLYYGKNYDKDSGKYTLKTFNIDNQAITGTTFSIANQITGSSQYVKAGQINFYTNQNVVFEWAEKKSGANSWAYYKYIPLKYDERNLTRNTITNFDNSNALANGYALDYSAGNELSKTRYENVLSSTFNSSVILSEQGLHIFMIEDEAGNITYAYLFIDKTSPILKQRIDGAWQDIKAHNVLSADVTIDFGKYKLINSNLTSANISSGENIDPWLLQLINDKYNLNQDSHADLNYFSGNTYLYFCPEISSTYYLTVGTQTTAQHISSGTYSHTIKFLQNDSAGNLEAVENNYTFYFVDESNPCFDIDFNSYTTNYSLLHNVVISSDLSMATVVFGNNLTDSSISLDSIQAGYTTAYTYVIQPDQTVTRNVDELSRIKYAYATDVENVFSYAFIPNPADNVQVEKVVLWYYPFVTENNVYKLRETATETIIYDRTNSINLATPGTDGYSNYLISNLEKTRINQIDMSKAGKYVITRTYTDSSKSYIEGVYDYIERKNVFIIDREPIVTAPQYLNGDYKSLIGGNVKIEMLSGQQNQAGDSITETFYNIYKADQDSSILSSNKLPLKAYIPFYKYGSLDNTNKFIADNELAYFFWKDGSIFKGDFSPRYNSGENLGRLIENNVDTYLKNANFTGSTLAESDIKTSQENSSFKLSVSVEYKAESSSSNATKLNINSTEQNFYTTENLTASGYYTISLKQNNECTLSNVAKKVFSFTFDIPSEAPQFDFLSSSRIRLVSDDSIKTSYTNEETVVITWQKAIDYRAEIDIEKSYVYRLGNEAQKEMFNPAYVVENGTTYSYEMDISHLSSGTSLVFHLEYEGLTEGIANRTAEKILYIDREAPVKLITELLATSLVDSNSFLNLSRKYVNLENQTTTDIKKYNVTVSDGALKFFTPIVDKADVLKLFGYENGIRVSQDYKENYEFYFKAFNDGEKFGDGSVQETSVLNALSAQNTTHTLINTDFQNTADGYYEIIERDAAGNLTIFTFYLVDRANKNETELLSYSSNEPNGTEQKTTSITLDEFTEENSFIKNIYAVSNFKDISLNLYNAKYFTLKIDNKVYLASPYLKTDEVYDISSWTNTSETPNIYKLSELIEKENINLSTSQVLKIRDINKTLTLNIYVTNQRLDYSQLSTGEGLKINQNQIIRLSEIKISAWSETLGYTPIYEMKNSFTSNEFVSVTASQNEISFSVNSPSNISYKYELTDNFGRKYSISHTHGTTVITDPVENHIAEETINNETYFIGNSALRFLYNRVDYKAEISVYALSVSSFQFSQVKTDELITTNVATNSYYSCQTSSSDKTVNIVTLKAPLTNTERNGFYGGVYSFTIKLTSLTDAQDVKIYNIVIDNLRAKINLTDKYGEDRTDLLSSSAIYSGLIKISFKDKLSMLQNSSLNDTQKAFMSVLVPKVSIKFGNDNFIDIESGYIVEDIGTYTLRVSQLYSGTYYIQTTSSFNISNSTKDFYFVSVLDETTGNYVVKEETGLSYTYNGTTYYSHYIVNNDYKIEENKEQSITTNSIATISDGNSTTTIYTLSNRDETNNPNIISFEKNIVVTQINKTDKILSNFSYIDAKVQTLNFDSVSKSIVVTAEEQNFDSLQIMWDSYYLVENNKVNIEITYNGEPYEPEVLSVGSNQSSIILTKSGKYSFKFTDFAGNTHLFSHSNYAYQTSSYELTYINGVIFNLNGTTPIMNAIYNDNVKLSVPSSSLGYYDSGSVPSIKVLRNGTEYSVKKDEDGNYNIATPGYYEVWFTAKYGGKDIRVQAYKFIIISKNESRWAFEYSEYLDYQIVNVTKNGAPLDLSSSSKTEIVNGKTVYKNMLASLYDEKTGAGRYYVEIVTNSGIVDEKFSFEFWINEGEIPLEISIAEGASTTSEITVTFNPYNIFNNIGECKITTGDQTLVIDEAYFAGTPKDLETLKVTTKGTHFIQVLTASGNLLYSYKVIKTVPLNASAIIIIVLVVVVAVALTITIVLLRKRMKIR